MWLIKIEDINSDYCDEGITDSDGFYYFCFDDLFMEQKPYVETSDGGLFDFGIEHDLIDSDKLSKLFTSEEVERIKNGDCPYETVRTIYSEKPNCGDYLLDDIESIIQDVYMSQKLTDELFEQVKEEVEDELGRDYLVTTKYLGDRAVELDECLEQYELEELVDDNDIYDKFLSAYNKKVNNE